MRASGYIILAGGLLVVVGGFLLALAGSGTEGLFVVFPFFVIGELFPVSIVVLAISFIVPLILFFFLSVRGTQMVYQTPWSISQNHDEMCPSCGAILPPGAEYCHKCGRALPKIEERR
jgi:ribosomal protein L40E